MAQWKEKHLRLKDRHGWKSKPGYGICVLDRGAIRFDYPAWQAAFGLYIAIAFGCFTAMALHVTLGGRVPLFSGAAC